MGRPLNVRNSLEVMIALEELYVDDDESDDESAAAVAVEGKRVDVDEDIAAMDNIL